MSPALNPNVYTAMPNTPKKTPAKSRARAAAVSPTGGNPPVSGELTPEIAAQLQQLAEDARALLPFLKSLSDAARQKSYKMGRKRLAFVEQAVTDAKGAPELIPARLDVAAFEARFQRTRDLSPLRDLFAGVASDLSDTVMDDGSAAVLTALEIKKLIQDAAKHNPAYEDRAKRLAELLRDADQAARSEGRTPPHEAGEASAGGAAA